MKSRPQLISWQCHASLIRVLATCYSFWYWARKVNLYPEDRAWTARGICGLVFGATLLLNDVFMLTIDRKRTNTSLGCVATQVVVNCCISGLTVLHVVLEAQWRFYFYFNYPGHSMSAAFEIFVLFGGLCSLGLLGISLWPIFALRSHIPVRQLWKTNAKDAFRGITTLPEARSCTLSVLGHPRGKTIPYPWPWVLIIVGRSVTVCFFRRIRPAETRVYAFARNSFAIVAIGILIFRTIAALQRAQNEIDTRVISRICDDASSTHDISILLDKLNYDSYAGVPFLDLNVSVSLTWPWSAQGDSYVDEMVDCPSTGVLWSTDSMGGYQNRTLELFNCPSPGFAIGEIQRAYPNIFPYYRINVQPIAAPFQTGAPMGPMPRIWLLNGRELSQPIDSNRSEVGEVRMYLPPLELLSGSQITAKAHLVTRKFLKSSIVKDIILNFKSVYRRLSLYPMVQSSEVPLNASDVNIATAIIRPVLTPGLMYHRSEVDAQNLNGDPGVLCDYVEDYRSGTVLDIVGSIGGLFALLHAAHLLLFGRPLLWGLTGAKMITPFGLLGQCSSRSFRRRLKEGYHVTSSEDGTETIRIVKFLQDFVIDFGPANVDLEQRPVSPAPVNNESPTDAQITMAQTSALWKESDDGGSNHSDCQDRIHEIV